MKKYFGLILLGWQLCLPAEGFSQIFDNYDNYIPQRNFKSIFFVGDDELVVRIENKVRRFTFSGTSSNTDQYSFDENLLKNLLYLDHQFIINGSGIYHHTFFKEIRKISDLKIELRPKKKSDDYPLQKFTFDRFTNTFVLTDNKTKTVHLLNAENGQLESIKIKCNKGDKLIPVNATYVYIKTEYDRKKENNSDIVIHLKSNEQKNVKQVSIVIAVSDTIAFVYDGKYTFMNLKTGEFYDWVNSLTNPNIQCCHHYLSQNRRYIISRGSTLSFSVYDIERKKIMTSSEFSSRTEQWKVYDNRMKDVIPMDLYYEFDDIEVSPDGKKYVFSEQNGWVLMVSISDYKKMFEYGMYRQNPYLKSKQQTAQTTTPSTQAPSAPINGVKELTGSFSMEYSYQWFNKTGNYKPMAIKIVVTSSTIQEYIWGNGAYVAWGGPCTIVHNKQETFGGKTGLFYVCSSGKKYFFFTDKGVNAVRVESGSDSFFDYIDKLPE
ncbi:MAG: hypothetical protein ACK4EX_10055 [Thermaurantimonas sp.]|uniref:hypothetical protein n=1 Tax=Thermaurantimonas sp. TaxID=2681568 RepID=UPI00391A4EDE